MEASRSVEEVDPIDWESGGIETQLGWSLNLAMQGFTRAGSVAVGQVPGGPRGYQVLIAITTEPPTSQLLLGQRLGIDKNAMTAVVDELEAGGHVERRPDPKDRRVRQVVPTPAAHDLLAAARVALHEVELAIMQPLDPDEQQQLRRLLARVALGIGDTSAVRAHQADDTNIPVGAPHRSDRRRTAPDHPQGDSRS